jgi:hypothetical protein
MTHNDMTHNDMTHNDMTHNDISNVYIMEKNIGKVIFMNLPNILQEFQKQIYY